VSFPDRELAGLGDMWKPVLGEHYRKRQFRDAWAVGKFVNVDSAKESEEQYLRTTPVTAVKILQKKVETHGREGKPLRERGRSRSF